MACSICCWESLPPTTHEGAQPTNQPAIIDDAGETGGGEEEQQVKLHALPFLPFPPRHHVAWPTGGD